MTARQAARRLLPENATIEMNDRTGRVYRTSPAGVELIWDEWTDPETGEVSPSMQGVLSAEEIAVGTGRGAIRILSLGNGSSVSTTTELRLPTTAQAMRASFKECFVLAAEQLIASGQMRATRAEFVRNLDRIVVAGQVAFRKKTHPLQSTRGGKIIQGERISDPMSGAVIHRWWMSWKRKGFIELDRYPGCGRGPRYSDSEDEFYKAVIDARLSEERPSFASITESVQGAVRAENAKRAAESCPSLPFAVPGDRKVKQLIYEIAPLDHAIRTRGRDVAYRNLHPLGRGLEISRVLQRVEIDEYETDLMVFMRLTGVLEVLSDEEKIALGLDGSPRRLTLSCAIDTFSSAILGLQIGVGPSVDFTLRTIDMIYIDKTPIAKVMGAHDPWDMFGNPETIAFDRAKVNMSDEIYQRLAYAGITNLGLPAGAPFLKPFIEQFFRKIGSKLLNRFHGRTFSDVVRKGENDPARRAVVTLDEFLHWLVVWIVDVHHTERPATLGKRSPAEMWRDSVDLFPPVERADIARIFLAFGHRETRLLRRDGISVNGLRYQHTCLAQEYLLNSEREVEIIWWGRQIGRIVVVLSSGKQVIADCVDPEWADKTLDDLQAQRARDRAADLHGQKRRDEFSNGLDSEMFRKAAVRNLLSPPPTNEQLGRQARSFMRHMNSPDRRPDHYGDVFDNEVPVPHGAPSRVAEPRLPDDDFGEGFIE